MISSSLDPFRNFDFWKSATVAEVCSEVERGAQIGSFPASTKLMGYPEDQPWFSRPEEALGRVGELREYGGLTLLHWAVAGGASAEVVSYLLSLGIPPGAHDSGNVSGATALHFAAQRGDVEVCELLLRWGTDIEAWSEWGTPLHWAVAGLDPKKMVVISDRYGFLSQMQADGGMLYLLPAGWMSDPIFRSELFQLGEGAVADPSDRVVGVWPTPCLNVATSRFLLENGADLGVRAPRFGWTVLHLAAMFNTNPDIARLLVENGADVTAIKESDSEYFEFDLDLGESDLDFDAITPLIAAALEGNLEVFEFLLDYNAPGLMGTDHSLLLHHLSLLGASREILGLLAGSGYDVHIRDENGNSALDYAVAGGNDEVVQFLAALGITLGAPLYPAEDMSDVGFSVREFVFHQYFGRGAVIAVEDADRDQLITVDFGDTVGIKVLSASFAPMRRLFSP